MRRNIDDITIHEDSRTHRTFEWYWSGDGEMPGLDAYEALTEDEQVEFLGILEGWGALPFGQSPPKSQVNVEESDPLILAVKAGRWRFPVYQAKGTATWIVCGPAYKKQGQQRDKRGDRCIERTIRQQKQYHDAIKSKEYYERNR